MAWDGYLFTTVAVGDSDQSVSCVWHVLNSDLFPLEADHAQSLLLYLDYLAPTGWSLANVDRVGDAPNLNLWTDSGDPN